MGHFSAFRFAVPALSSLALALSSCGADVGGAGGVEKLEVSVVDTLPFDATSFTQGLELAPDGSLYVGTGQEGSSRVYRRTLEGEELVSQDLEPQYFGEGVTRTGDTLWQLTWQHGVAFKRDADTLEEIGRATYSGEGWGICAREDEVMFSDGTAQLRRMDPDTLEERERFTVTLDGQPVDGLNELECVGADVYANIFTTTDIVRIDAQTGAVTALIDASALPSNAPDDPNNVLNGIAHIPDSGSDGGDFLLAGKRWPQMYRVSFVPAGSQPEVASG